MSWMYFYIVDCSKCMKVVFKWPSFTFFSLLNPLRTWFHPLKLQHKTKSFTGLLFWLVGLLRATLPCWTQSEMCCKEQITKEVPQWPSTHLDSPDPLQFSLLADPPLKWRGAVPVCLSATFCPLILKDLTCISWSHSQTDKNWAGL